MIRLAASPFAKCPFCASKFNCAFEIPGESRPHYVVICEACHARGPLRPTLKEACQAWADADA